MCWVLGLGTHLSPWHCEESSCVPSHASSLFLGTLWGLSYLFRIALGDEWVLYAHFIDGKTEAQRAKAISSSLRIAM